jgi:hypothetical protein
LKNFAKCSESAYLEDVSELLHLCFDITGRNCAVRVIASNLKRAAMIHEPINDNNKQRLTSREDILVAINILRLRGVDPETLTREIIRLFYVDLDTYNEVLSEA